MRNFKLIFAAFISMFYITAFTQQYGFWMLHNINHGNDYSVNQIYFEDGQPPTLIQIDNSNSYAFEEDRNSSGGYYFNGDLMFFNINGELYHANDPDNIVEYLHNEDNSKMNPEMEIINRPGYEDRFFVYYSIIDDQKEEQGSFYEAEYSINSNGSITEYHNSMITNINTGTGYSSMAISSFWDGPANNLKRDLYCATSSAGLIHLAIKTNGYDANSYDELINHNDHPLGNNNYFNSYNMELKEIDDEPAFIAWISMYSNGNYLFLYDIDEEYLFSIDMGLGRLAGIEFSPIEDDIIYISYEITDGVSEGIVKYDFINQNIEGYITSTLNNHFYGNTYLQTAPDGNIYAVADDGLSLARIVLPSETFEEEIFTFGLTNGINTFITHNSNEYYILPENTQTWTALSATYSVIDYVSCPGYSDGCIEVIPNGGYEPYSYAWYYDEDLTNPISGETNAELCGYPVGTYYCLVTDSDNPANEVIVEAFIEIDPNQFNYSLYNVHDGGDIFWEYYNFSYEQGIQISNNTHLTISNSTLEFGKYAEVIIEPGSKLTLNNTTLTYFENCPDMWQGVRVWGIDGETQYEIAGVCPQGQLIMNDSKIEYAINGVALWNPGDWNSMGGVVKAYNSEFINNKRSVEFYSFHNFYPGWPNDETPNESRFEECTFEVNSNYLDIPNNPFNKHITMWDVMGAKIIECEFISQTSLFSNGQAIHANQSGFKVEGGDTYSLFQGFQKGITVATNNGYAISIDDASFYQNEYGVQLDDVSGAVITNSNFLIGYNQSQLGLCGTQTYSYGIDMHNCFGFAIEENYFEQVTGPPDGEYVGIRATECPSEYDIIYKNQFHDLTYANLAEETNRDDPNNDQHGIEYQCNTNSGNSIDFKVSADDPHDAMIRTDQGSRNMASGNTFSIIINPDDYHWYHNSYEKVDYYYDNNASNSEPTKIFELPGGNYFEARGTNIPNNCQSHYGGGTGKGNDNIVLSSEDFLIKEQQFLQALSDYNAVSDLYESLKDGGNTQNLQTEIETSWPNDMWELRAELLGQSPHLSKEILMTASAKTDVLPESVIFEILAANPDELDDSELMSFLQNKEQPLPQYMIDILTGLTSEITYKTLLEESMSEYHSVKTQAAQDIIRSIMNAEVFDLDLYRNWLDNMASITTDKALANSYINKGDYTTAQSILDLIPQWYNLEGEELQKYNDYRSFKQMQINWLSEGRNIFQLSEDEIASLEVFTENKWQPSSEAQGILTFAYGYEFCNCPSIGDGSKSSNNYNEWHSDDNFLSISAKPNPASTWTAFDYELPLGTTTGTIEINDVSGRVVQTFTIEESQGQIIWDIRNMDAGVYIYTFKASGLTKSGKLVIK